jgi:hypothetical protein
MNSESRVSCCISMTPAMYSEKAQRASEGGREKLKLMFTS